MSCGPPVDAVSGSGWTNRGEVSICQSSFQDREAADGPTLRISSQALSREHRHREVRPLGRRPATVGAGQILPVQRVKSQLVLIGLSPCWTSTVVRVEGTVSTAVGSKGEL